MGVAYLVSRALENINRKKEVDIADRRNTIYAALLHDVGHGPLGHVLDKFYDRLQKGNEHEKFTKEFIDDGLIDLREVLEEVNMNFSEVKDRTVFKSQNSEELKKYGDKLYLAWLITDYAIDLDRLDFLMRDLLMTSYKCKSILPVKLQKELMKPEILCRQDIFNKIIKDFIDRLSVGTVDELDDSCKDKFPDDARILYINNRGEYNLKELLDYLLNLYTEMYTNVYYNDRISGAEAMMAKALHIAYDAGDIDRSHLYTFTDSELMAYLENLENDLIREIVYSVKHRRIFKPIIQFDLNNMPENISPTKVESKIEERFDLDQNDYKSMVIVNIPRKKELKNLFIKEGDKIISYPGIQEFKTKLSNNIKGKIFIHPSIFRSTEEKHNLLDLLAEIGIFAEFTPLEVTEEHHKTSLNHWLKCD